MAQNIQAGFNLQGVEPIDSRMVHAGRPWTNPNLLNGLAVYEGLISVDTTGDGTVWYLSDASQATVEAGWNQIGPVTEDYIMTTNEGQDNQVLSLQVSGTTRTLEWVNQTGGTTGGVPSGAALPTTVELDTLFLLTTRQGQNEAGLYFGENSPIDIGGVNTTPRWTPVNIPFDYDAGGGQPDRIAGIVYDRARRRLRYRLTNGETVGDDFDVLLGTRLVSAFPTTGIDGTYATLAAVTGEVNQYTFTITSLNNGTFSAPEDFARVHDLLEASVSVTGTGGTTTSSFSGTITNLQVIQRDPTANPPVEQGSIVITLEGFEGPVPTLDAGTNTFLQIYSAPHDGIFVEDGAGNVQSDHYATLFTGSSIVNHEGLLQIDTNPDLTAIRNNSPGNAGQFLQINQDGDIITTSINPGGGVTEAEVQQDIRDYVNPYAVSSRVEHSFEARMEPGFQTNVNVAENRVSELHRAFNIRRINDGGSSGSVLISFPTEADALRFYVAVTNASSLPAAGSWTTDPFVTFRAAGQGANNTPLILSVEGIPDFTIPVGTTINRGSATQTGYSHSPFWVRFDVPSPDQATLAPTLTLTNAVFVGPGGSRRITFPANHGAFPRPSNIEGSADQVFEIGVRASAFGAGDIREGQLIRLEPENSGPRFGPDPGFPIIGRVGTISVYNGGPRGEHPELSNGDRIVPILFYNQPGISNPNGGNSEVTVGWTTNQFVNANILSHSTNLDPQFFLNSNDDNHRSSIRQSGLPSRQHTDADGISYDAVFWLGTPNMNNIHFVTEEINNLSVGTRLFGFQYDNIPQAGFPETMTQNSVTFNTEDLHADVTLVNQASVGRANPTAGTQHIVHAQPTTQLQSFLFGTAGQDNLFNLNGQIQAFYSRQGQVGDGATIDGNTGFTGSLTIANATIDGRDGQLIEISNQGSQAYLDLRARLDVIRNGSNPRSATSIDSDLTDLELGVATGTLAGTSILSVHVRDSAGDAVSGALVDENNWAIVRQGGNWHWFYTGNQAFESTHELEVQYRFRRPLQIVFLGGNRLLDGTTIDPNIGSDPNDDYPALGADQDYFRRFVRLQETDTRIFFQGDTTLGTFQSTIAGELNGDIPFATGPALGRSGLYLKTITDDIRFTQRESIAPQWSGVLTPPQSTAHVARNTGGTYSLRDGSTRTANPFNADQAGRFNQTRFGIVLINAGITNSATNSDYMDLLGIQTLLNVDLSGGGIYNPAGVRTRDGHELVIRWAQPDGTNTPVQEQSTGWIVVGIGPRSVAGPGPGRGPASPPEALNEAIIEIAARTGATLPSVSFNAAVGSRIQRATNDPAEQHQILESNGFALFRYDREAANSNGRGAFTEVIVPATTATLGSSGDQITP